MNQKGCFAQRGLSLIELMIAMLISLLLLGGVLQVFLSSKELYHTNTAVARVQEAGRFATEFVAFDVRQAGYKGECLGEPVNHLNLTSASADLRNAYSTSPAIQGWENSKPVIFAATEQTRADTDALIVKYAGSGLPFEPQGTHQIGGPNLGVDGSTGAFSGQIVIAANSTGCDIFQNTANQQATTFNTSGGNVTPGNRNVNWSQSYTEPLSAYILQSHIYYIRDNAGRLPSLVRKALSPSPHDEELVEGVIDMQVTYGLDKDGDRLADDYVKAGTNNLVASGEGDWNKVVSARISLLVVSPEINALEEPQVFVYPAVAGIVRDDDFATYDDGTVTIKNNRIAQVFTTTVAIRNRLP
ncbi:PilW family protein [Stutzerimonas urumqiensis]|uniref:PilW family protein n=1 Tax=Stutzerimonas urumqiensis TaxID=638269 RepID=UPI003DA2C944